MYQAYSLEMPACSILKPSQAGWKLCSFGGRGGCLQCLWLVLDVLC